MENKILVVNPPHFSFCENAWSYLPLGTAYIHSVLKNNNYNSTFMDLDYQETLVGYPTPLELCEKEYKKQVSNLNNVKYKTFEKKLREEQPNFVLMGIHSSNIWPVGLNLAKITKKIFPTTCVIIGGAHPTLYPNECMDSGIINIVVKGEGEETIIELLDCLINKKDIDKVKGIVYKKKNKNISTEHRNRINNLSTLPFASKYLETRKKIHPSYYSTLTTSRGCSYRCSFCVSPILWQKKVKFRQPSEVVDEIEFVKNKYGTRFFNFIDDSITLSRHHIISLCDILNKRKLNISWTCLSRINNLDEELIKKMAKNGCYFISLGIESANEKRLKEINKEITLDQIRNIITLLKQYNILIEAYFIVGFPNETKEERIEILNLVKELKPDTAKLFYATPFLGTSLYSKEKKIDNLNMNIHFKQGKFDKKQVVEINKFSKYFYRLIRTYQKRTNWKLLRSKKYVLNKLREDFPNFKRYFRYIKNFFIF